MGLSNPKETIRLHQQLTVMTNQITQLQADHLGAWGKLMATEILDATFKEVQVDTIQKQVLFLYTGNSTPNHHQLLARSTLTMWVNTLLGLEWKTQVRVDGIKTSTGKTKPKSRRVRRVRKVRKGR